MPRRLSPKGRELTAISTRLYSNHIPKKTTIDELAAMIKGGFDEVHTRLDRMAIKDDLQAVRMEMATKQELRTLEQKVDDGFQHVYARLDIIRDDISDLPTMREELHDIRHRIERLEQKAGLAT